MLKTNKITLLMGAVYLLLPSCDWMSDDLEVSLQMWFLMGVAYLIYAIYSSIKNNGNKKR